MNNVWKKDLNNFTELEILRREFLKKIKMNEWIEMEGFNIDKKEVESNSAKMLFVVDNFKIELSKVDLSKIKIRNIYEDGKDEVFAVFKCKPDSEGTIIKYIEELDNEDIEPKNYKISMKNGDWYRVKSKLNIKDFVNFVYNNSYIEAENAYSTGLRNIWIDNNEVSAIEEDK